MAPKPPIDFSKFRETIVRAVFKTTGLTCIRMEPSTPDAPRPNLPYFGYKMTSPAIQHGWSTFDYQSGQKFNYGSQMEMNVSFNCFAVDQDDAYGYMIQWQQNLNSEVLREFLRKAGLAVWEIGNLADSSLLLNTGYQGRAQMDVRFGYASNLGADLGTIDQVEIEGSVDSNTIDIEGP